MEPSKGAGRLLDRMDAAVVDRAVVAVEQVTDLNAAGSTWFEKYVIYGAINVGVAHNHDATVAQFCLVEMFADADAHGCNNVFDLLVFEHLVKAGTLDIEDLTAQGQDGLEVAVAALFCTVVDKNAAG